jgi:hypothetical protein
MNTDNIKHSHNIVDYIHNFVPLKKAGVGEYVGLCPFHSEKTPSFTVSERKQFYYCYGCGATGDIIKFVEQYQGVEFMTACGILGGQLDELDVRTISANRARPIISYPKFDKRDPIKTAKYLEKCEPVLLGEVSAYQYKGEWLVPIFDADTGENVNLYNVRNGKFLCGGVSHGASSQINRNASKECFIVVDFDVALKLAQWNKDLNIVIAYSAYNLKLIIDSSDCNFFPIITTDDTHAHSLTNTHDYVFFDGENFVDKNRGEDFE